MRRIICAGNRYVRGDDAGPRVHDVLSRTELPPGVEVLDGGLAGLNLAGFVEGAEKVVFVDHVVGLGPPGKVLVIGSEELLGGEPPSFGHADGLNYLLHCLPILFDGRHPEVALVGIEGDADDRAVHALAQAALKAVTE